MRRENIKNDAVISTFISHQPLNSNRKHVVHAKITPLYIVLILIQ